MNVYVFKTSLQKRDVKFVKPFLEKYLPFTKWNIDFKDSDRILRIESQKDISAIVCNGINELGFLCSELE